MTSKFEDLTNEDGTVIARFSDHVDSTTFEQILEMDDDEDEREFSRSIVTDFFDQASTTFDSMLTSLEERDLKQLSALGHFLKGSSATLGLTKVKNSCEKIQNFGAMKDETGAHDEPDENVCLERCRITVEQTMKEFDDAEALLRKFYSDENN